MRSTSLDVAMLIIWTVITALAVYRNEALLAAVSGANLALWFNDIVCRSGERYRERRRRRRESGAE